MHQLPVYKKCLRQTNEYHKVNLYKNHVDSAIKQRDNNNNNNTYGGYKKKK